MGFNKVFGCRDGATSSNVSQHETMSSTGLAKTASRPKSNRDSINSKTLASKNIKIAVAAYSIQRRVLETLHDVLQANLREDHAMDLWGFKRSLRDHAVKTRTKRHLESARASCITGYNCFNEPASYEECVISACTFVYQKLAIAKFMVLQAKERTAAAKECKEQLNGLRKEFGDCIVLGKNGGIREVDCASEQRALLAEWGLANTKTENSGRKWEDDLRDMVRLSVSREREEKVRPKRRASEKISKEAEEARRVSAGTRPRRLSVIWESSEEK